MNIDKMTEKGIKIYYADPAGNITAIVRGLEQASGAERLELANAVLEAQLAEQVGFEIGGRLEMMGGEFCGNAARAYGYLKALEEFGTGVHELEVEISGASEPVRIVADLDNSEASAKLARPRNMVRLIVDGKQYSVVRMAGIDHLIAYGRRVDELWGRHAIEAMREAWNPQACGVMFLSPAGELTPLVYVRDTDSLVWESSCGSGSIAAGYYLNRQGRGINFTFREPGGEIQVVFGADNVSMGGKIRIQG